VEKKFGVSAEDAEKNKKDTRTAYCKFLRRKKKVLSGSGRETTRK